MNERSKRIREAINKKDISFAELEKMTGVSKSALQRYASGQTKKIPIDVIEKIAGATGVTARYLMGWENEKPPEPQITEKQADAIKLICSLSPEEFDKTEEYVKFIISQRENKSLD